MTLGNENFLYKKINDYFLMQSPSLANIIKLYSNQLFCNGIFYVTYLICHQLFTIRAYSKDLHMLFIIAYVLIKNKEQKKRKYISSVKTNIINISNISEFKSKELYYVFEITFSML